MAMTEINVTKKGSTRPVLTLVRGDERTHIVRMIVQRFYGGVDLSHLVWSVVTRNPNGVTDTYYISDTTVNDATITVDWLVRGTSTLADGETEFELEGIAYGGENTSIWQSGKYILNVTEDVNHTPNDDEAAQLTAVQELILYVNGELNNVIQAGKDANAAAEEARKAANDTPGMVESAFANLKFSINDGGYLVVEQGGSI